MWLHEQAADLAVELADELAVELADQATDYTAPVLDRFQNVTVELQASGALWVSVGEMDPKRSRAEVVALSLAFRAPNFAPLLHSALEDHLCATGGPALQAILVNAA